jgi:integrase/recombinase XerC
MLKEDFINHIRFEKRYSHHTIQAYSNDLKQFTDYMALEYGEGDISGAGHQQIRSWMVSMIGEGISARSVLRKLSTLKSFYRYLIRNGLLDHNPTLVVGSPKMPVRNPVFVEEQQMADLFAKVDFGQGLTGCRDRMILELFYGTGMRLAELIALEEGDLSLESKTLKVYGKRNKERIIPFTDKTAAGLAQYIQMKRESGLEAGNLFVTEKGVKLYPRLVYRLVNRYLGQVTTLAKKSPHILRHTFATHMLNRGADLNAVKEFLGHSNLAATQVYTHNTVEKLKKIYHQAHPRA